MAERRSRSGRARFDFALVAAIILGLAVTGLALAQSTRPSWMRQQDYQSLTARWPVAPGNYTISLGSRPDLRRGISSACLTFSGDRSHVVLENCATISPGRWFVVPTETPRQFNIRNGGHECLAVARGVVFGPPRIDIAFCDGQAVGGVREGADDQKVILRPVQGEQDTYNVTTTHGCWARRHHQERTLSREVVSYSDLIEAECNFSDHSQWFVFILDFASVGMNRSVMEQRGWRSGWGEGVATRDFYHPMRRAAPIVGIDLPGGDYWSAATENDQGQQCARICAEDRQCQAFTWVPPKPDGSEAARCWLKDRRPAPSEGPGMASAYVYGAASDPAFGQVTTIGATLTQSPRTE